MTSQEDALVNALRGISHTMRSLYEGRGSQRRVLIVLQELGPTTQRELTARLGIQPGSASEVITKLEHAGLLRRSLSQSDRRTADITLTEEGLRQAQDALEQRRRRHEEMFSALSEGEREQLLDLLEKLNGDWSTRYHTAREDREGHRHHGHPGEHGRHGEHGRPGCDHDCEHCPHPCGRGRGR